MFTCLLRLGDRMRPFLITAEEEIVLEQVRVLPPSMYRVAVLALVAVGLFIAAAARPGGAEAAVSGQQAAWNIEFGNEHGQLYNPKMLGVDPVDGSVYISSTSPNFSETRIEKFSEGGAFEGSISLSRTSELSGATGRKGMVGIAVDHAAGRFYVIQDEAGVDSAEPAARVATKVLAFSTQPVSEALVPASTPTLPLPAPESANELIHPNEIAVDPSNGDLIISALNPAGKVVLQRIGSDGTEGKRYTEMGSTLVNVEEGTYAFAVANDGTIYVLNKASSSVSSLEAFTLPPDFEPPSGPLALTALPGFEAAEASEEWSHNNSGRTFFQVQPSVANTGQGFGPQMAITTAPDGEETLFWKAISTLSEAEAAGDILLHGYSLQSKATTTAFGLGATQDSCKIQTNAAAIAPAKDGSVVVLDQGGPEIKTEGEAPIYGPSVLRFGPGGTECPDPAAAIGLKSGSSEVSTVPAGTSVTLDASGSELGKDLESHDRTLKALTWTIEGPGGTETVVAPGTPPSKEVSHVFGTEGIYTIRLKMKVEPSILAGTTFSAKPKKLTVTAGSGTTPAVTGLNPNHGPASGGTVVTITGTNLTGASEVKFGSTAATNLTPVSATELKATSPPCTAGTTADVTVITAGGTSATGPSDIFTCDSAGGTTPTVTGLNPNHGPATGGTVVTISGEHLTGATEVKFGSTAATNLTPVSATELKATSPAGAASAKVDVTVVSGGGTSATGAADQFSYDAAAMTHSLTITKVGTGSGAVSCDGGLCQGSYPAGSLVHLTAAPAGGSTFVGWSGGGCTGTGPCTVVVNANMSITATFNTSLPGGGQDPPVSSAPASSPPASNPPASSPPSGGKTQAQILAAKRKKALAKCKKLHGKARARCVKRANQIGKSRKKKA